MFIYIKWGKSFTLKILMAAQVALTRTPKEIYNRQTTIHQYCRLCNENSNQRLLHAFHKVGIAKGYQQIIYETTGVKIQADDFLSTAICCKCERKVESNWTFRKSSRIIQIQLHRSIT